MRFAACEKGGFITIAVGREIPAASSLPGRMFAICSASSVVTRSGLRPASSAARRADSSLTTTFAPASLAYAAIPPTPAEGSSTTSDGERFASQAATKA